MPRKSSLSEEQIYEAQFWLLALREKGLTWAEIAEAVGYSSGSTACKVANGHKRPSKEKYLAIESAYNVYDVMPKPSVNPSPKTTTAPRGCLSQLDAIHADIGAIIDRLHKLSDECLPLLRPGLKQYAQSLEQGRKILEIT